MRIADSLIEDAISESEMILWGSFQQEPQKTANPISSSQKEFPYSFNKPKNQNNKKKKMQKESHRKNRQKKK